MVSLSQASYCYLSWISKNPGSGVSDSSDLLLPPRIITGTTEISTSFPRCSCKSRPAVSRLLFWDLRAQEALPDFGWGLCQSLLAVDFDPWKTNGKSSIHKFQALFILLYNTTVTRVLVIHISFSLHLDTEHLFQNRDIFIFFLNTRGVHKHLAPRDLNTCVWTQGLQPKNAWHWQNTESGRVII